MIDPLTHEEKTWAFRKATGGFARALERNPDWSERGMTDEEIAAVLRDALGIMGGSGGPGRPTLTWQGAGLKIWAGRNGVSHIHDKPLYQGAATVAMARNVYGIRDPEDRQMRLF